MSAYRRIRSVIHDILTGRSRRVSATTPPTAAPELVRWSDAELYAVWCATTSRLHTDQASTAAEAREYLLAEIERRHPTRTEAWINSDALSSGQPPRFLVTDHA